MTVMSDTRVMSSDFLTLAFATNSLPISDPEVSGITTIQLLRLTALMEHITGVHKLLFVN